MKEGGLGNNWWREPEMIERVAQQTDYRVWDSRLDFYPVFPGICLHDQLTQVTENFYFTSMVTLMVNLWLIETHCPITVDRDGDTKQLMSDTNPFRAVITVRLHITQLPHRFDKESKITHTHRHTHLKPTKTVKHLIKHFLVAPNKNAWKG